MTGQTGRHHPKPVSQLKALAVLMARLKAENERIDREERAHGT